MRCESDPHSHPEEKAGTIFAPALFRSPQRRNVEPVDATALRRKIDEQIEAFRRKRS